MNINKKLKLLKNEDLIWVIYFFITISAIISNYFERKYLLSNNKIYQKKFKLINITIFVLAFFIYLYFVLVRYDSIKILKKETSKKEVITEHISLLASLLFLIGGFLFIITEINSDTINEDISLI